MINRRTFLAAGARAGLAAAGAYAGARLAQGGWRTPAQPAVAGRLEYTVTSLASGVSSPPVSVVLRPQGAPVPGPTPTPFTASSPGRVQTAVPVETPLGSLVGALGEPGFRLSVQSAQNIDGAAFTWDFGPGRVWHGESVDIRPDAAGALGGTLHVSAGDRRLASIPLVRLAAYDTPPILSQGAPHIGVQAHVNFDLPENEGGIQGMANVQKAINRIKDLGMNLARTDWIWEKIETTPGEYGWNNWQYEDVLQLLAANGIGSLAILKGTPLWCSSRPDLDFPGFWNVPPTDPRLYGRFVYHFLERFGDAIKMIEVYQEPNVSLYWNFDAAGLAACQREAFLHAKYANPNVAVGFTGLVGVPERATRGADGYWHYGPVLFEQPEVFLNRVYQATGGRAWWDTMGLHIYPDMDLFSTSRGFDLSRSIAFIDSIKAVMRAYGDTTPFSVTEVGTSTPRDQPPPSAVAQYLGQLIDMIRTHTACPVLIWYRLNEGPNWASPDDRRGLATHDLSRLTAIGETMKVYVAQH